ncbi:Bifunctional inhibitor/plant lipid transfer protein/seed storage helical domain [Spatholobus suberectus]|nr:Bifunctional inhibitor/plant lipid transfer protein/seed storage helical domain [Spatholobus suberectus]
MRGSYGRWGNEEQGFDGGDGDGDAHRSVGNATVTGTSTEVRVASTGSPRRRDSTVMANSGLHHSSQCSRRPFSKHCCDPVVGFILTNRSTNMASASTYLTFAMLVVAGSLIYNTKEVSAQCGGSVSDLVAQCSQFVQKSGPFIRPSPGCCAVLKKFNVPCACKLVTKEVANLVSVPKAIFVARSCGLNLPPGMQCGAIKVPPKFMK